MKIQVVEDIHLKKEKYQFRFPKSKKKRIRKKWSKRESNFRYKEFYLKIGNTLFVSKKMYDKIKKNYE